MKNLKTPLRYPGGKSRATTKISQFFPDLRKIRQYREPFIGGGSVAIHVSKMYPDMSIWVNDLYEPLVNFWQQLQMFGPDLSRELASLKSAYDTPEKAKELFLASKDKVNDRSISNFDRAVAFYVVNKCSFSGLTESSSFSAQASNSNFSMRGIENLSEYSKIIAKWKITNYSYEQLFCGGQDIFIYLDPPYEIKDNLYGKKGNMHKGFDHDLFAEKCNEYNVKMMVSYNSSNLIKDRFNGWFAHDYDHTYTMRSTGDYMSNQKDRKELLLVNYEHLLVDRLSEVDQSDETESDD